jgi:acyl carrier protein
VTAADRPDGALGAARQRVAALVERASDQEVPASLALAGGSSLPDLGVTSLASMRLVDALDQEFGVALSLDGDVGFLDSVDGIVDRLVAEGAVLPGGAAPP